jgi:sugar O-acyltransferase (sialic acid O-acetyltransferase NeuD family)
MKIIILGAGGHAAVIADALLCRKQTGEEIDIVGFLDDDSSLKGKQWRGIDVLGRIDIIRSVEYDALVVGVGNNKTREKIFNTFSSQKERITTVIHPSSVIAQDVTIEAGSVVFAGTVINTGSYIGQNVIINTGATVDHHAKISSHVHLAPGVHLGGTVSIGEGSFLGIGTNVLPNLTIGEWSVIGAGSTIISDIPSHVTAVGVPAKIIKSKQLEG